jgi:hypothetical protein
VARLSLIQRSRLHRACADVYASVASSGFRLLPLLLLLLLLELLPLLLGKCQNSPLAGNHLRDSVPAGHWLAFFCASCGVSSDRPGHRWLLRWFQRLLHLVFSRDEIFFWCWFRPLHSIWKKYLHGSYRLAPFSW